MATKISLFNDEEFQQIIKESYSYAECCRKIGYSINGSYGSDVIKKRCKEMNLSTAHFSSIRAANITSTKYSLDEILIENSTYKNISRLKERLIKEKRLEYKCAICGNIGEWNGKRLTLQLDHINGKHNDHRIFNLRFLCPNCHSQTENFSGKNKNKDNTELNQQ